MAEFNPFGQMLQSKIAGDQYRQQQQQNAMNQRAQDMNMQVQQRQLDASDMDMKMKMLNIAGPVAKGFLKLDPQKQAMVWPGLSQELNKVAPGIVPEGTQFGPELLQQIQTAAMTWESLQKPVDVGYEIKQNAQGEYVRIPKQPGYQVSPTGVVGEVGKGKTEIKVDMTPGAQQPKFLETVAKDEAARLNDYSVRADRASSSRYSLQSQRALIEQGLETGKLQPLLQGVSAYAEGFGIDPKSLNLPDPSLGQAFNQASFDQLLKTLQAQKGPQTEGDAARARKTFAGLGNTKEANIFIIDYLEELTNREEQMADKISSLAVDKYGNDKRPVYKAEQEYRAWAKNHPVVATSKSTGLPITYTKYREAALENNIPESEIDKQWRAFAGVK